jgi:hypothetical protein
VQLPIIKIKDSGGRDSLSHPFKYILSFIISKIKIGQIVNDGCSLVSKP